MSIYTQTPPEFQQNPADWQEDQLEETTDEVEETQFGQQESNPWFDTPNEWTQAAAAWWSEDQTPEIVQKSTDLTSNTKRHLQQKDDDLETLLEEQEENAPKEQPTCVLKGQTAFGPYQPKPDGTPSATKPPASSQDFDDWSHLYYYESPDYSYRLTSVQLCTNEDLDLVGLQSFIGYFSNTTKKQLKTQTMTKIGNTSTGLCQTLNIDPLNNEYISGLAMRYGNQQIDAIALTSNTGNVIFAGNFPDKFEDKFRTFWSNEPLIGFFGTSTENQILSLGEVVVETNCLKKSGDTFSPNSESGVFISQNEWREMSGLDQNTTIIIVFATFFATAMIIFGIVWTCYWLKGKKDGTSMDTIEMMNDMEAQNGNYLEETGKGIHVRPNGMPQQERKQSVKRGKNGQMEIHQELDQQNGTDLEIEDYLEIEAAVTKKMHRDNSKMIFDEAIKNTQ